MGKRPVGVKASSSGSGSGDGDGYGDGYGSGDGYGDGDGYINAVLHFCAGKSGWKAKKNGATLAFWKSAADGKPANGGGGPPRNIGLIETISGPLEICTSQALHGTLQPWKWKGERLWIVALYGETQTRDDKIAALKREILAEISHFC